MGVHDVPGTEELNMGIMVQKEPASDGRRLWVARGEIWKEDEDGQPIFPARQATAVFQVLETDSGGPAVLELLSYTWSDTRTPVQGHRDELKKLTKAAATKEADHLEGWMDG